MPTADGRRLGMIQIPSICLDPEIYEGNNCSIKNWNEASIKPRDENKHWRFLLKVFSFISMHSMISILLVIKSLKN